MKVKLCTECEGTGEVRKRVDVYNSEWLDCDECGGSGRIVILRFRKELPYNGDTSDYYNVSIGSIGNNLTGKSKKTNLGIWEYRR